MRKGASFHGLFSHQVWRVGDGATNDAAAIQSAIDACNAAGGGRVVLEGGHTYYSSSIELKSNVELHLEQGALLKAHSDISTYFNPNGDDASVAAVSGAKAVDRPVAKPAYTFIHAKDADNFSITVRAQWTAMFMPL